MVYEKPDDARTGFGRAVWSISKAFANQGIQVRIVYTLSEDSKEVIKDVVNNVCLYGIPTKGRLVSKRIAFYKDATRLIKNLANRNHPSIFILNGPFSLPLARPLKCLGVVIYHTFGSLIVEFAFSLKELILTRDVNKLMLYISDIPLELTLVHNVDSVMVPHVKAAMEFELGYGIKKSKILISPYGQDIYERFHNNEFFNEVKIFRSKYFMKKLILFVGGTGWNRKGARYILHTFHKVRRKVPSILIMTGKPTKEYLVLAGRLELKINEDILLPGLVDDRTLAFLYASCDVFALPSLHEGFSQPVIEVMAYGKPVVASPIAAYPTVKNGSEGFVINSCDIDSCADALQKILTDKDLYANMSQKAKLKAQQYSWDKIGFNLIKYFQQIVSKSDIKCCHHLE